MKKISFTLLSAFLFLSLLFSHKVLYINNASAFKENNNSLSIDARGIILMDKETGKVLYEKDADSRFPVASMTKTMTLLLTYEAIENSEVKPSDMVNVSSYAASQEGSECFLDAGKDYRLSELIKAVVIASANDACVAIAEHLAGSEELFAEKMNRRAEELGLKNTSFKNSTGLNELGHYSSARDIALVMSKLSEYDEYTKLSRIWMDKIVHSGGRVTELVNTNRLIRTSRDCICGKTGYTDEAMYCLVAVAKRDNMTLISCIIGDKSKEKRVENTQKLFNYGFSNFEPIIVMEKSKKLTDIEIKNAKQKAYPVYLEKDITFISKKGESLNTDTKIVIDKNLVAPIKKNTKVGIIEIYQNGVMIDSENILLGEDAEKNTYRESLKRELKEFRRF